MFVPEKRNKWGGGFRKLVRDYAWAILPLLLEGLYYVGKRPWMCNSCERKLKEKKTTNQLVTHSKKNGPLHLTEHNQDESFTTPTQPLTSLETQFDISKKK